VSRVGLHETGDPAFDGVGLRTGAGTDDRPAQAVSFGPLGCPTAGGEGQGHGAEGGGWPHATAESTLHVRCPFPTVRLSAPGRSDCLARLIWLDVSGSTGSTITDARHPK